MDRPTRRTFVGATGTAIGGVAAGCLDGVGETDADPGSGDDTDTDPGTDDDETDGTGASDGDARVDEPPHEIERPDVDDADEPWEHWNEEYLGEHMAAEPSVAFDSLESVRLADYALQTVDYDGPIGAYAVRLVRAEDELDDVIDLGATDDEPRSTLEAVDFDERVVIVVESGFGSGSIEHRWARVEAVDDGLHCHGYYTQPYEQTDDLATRHSVLVADRPAEDDPDDEIDLARASLTIAEDRRVTFDSTAGVVTVDEE